MNPDSPHARGWTREEMREGVRTTGFPARAGMDPVAAADVLHVRRIPRTRGDGPEAARLRRRPGVDSPHARGWTRVEVRPPTCTRGFPARAGMDLGHRGLRGLYVWIPRTRGDGPDTEAGRPRGRRDSPHARGWTVHGNTRFRAPGGFPARAGMDPSSARPSARPSGIPRTRGDGPDQRLARTADRQDSPHARGWTADGEVRSRRVQGFPARAGMDPASASAIRTADRIPRTRGDGPAGVRGRPAPTWDSPHARGWTR